jgi:hypothetical protein
MIVFDLLCSNAHKFEAWFGSTSDYEAQKTRGLVSCPMCGDAAVEKAVMAPAVGAKGNQRRASLPVPAAAGETDVAQVATGDRAKLAALIEQLAKAQAKALEGSAWVGDAFADKARAMHYGEETAAPIHGVAEPKEARALLEEGIAVAPLPLPVVPPAKRN